MLPDCAIFAADALLLANLVFQKFSGGNNRLSYLSGVGGGNSIAKPMETLVRQIEQGMHGKEWRHSAIYERDLERFWPLNETDREAKIAQFARQYGFRLRFYSKGNVAIFDKPPAQ